MPQADIINIKKSTERHPDYTILQLVATWHVARAKARLVWDEHKLRSLFDTQDAETICPHEAIDSMMEAQHYFAQLEPVTTLGAQVMLQAAVDILSSAQLDPDATLGSGPILEMIVNVARSLSKRDVPLSAV